MSIILEGKSIRKETLNRIQGYIKKSIKIKPILVYNSMSKEGNCL